MTTHDIDSLVMKTLLIPGQEQAFRDALAAGHWDEAVECVREHRIDDLVYGAMEPGDVPGGTGYTPRWDFFAELTPFLNDDDYFRLLGRVLVEVEKYARPEEVECCFAPTGRDASKRRLVMRPDELLVYDSLPTRLTVYRGCTRETREGCSWSRSEAVARHFAQHPASVVDGFSSDDQTSVVIRGTCSKTDVWAVFTRWNEEEILILPRHVTGKTETVL